MTLALTKNTGGALRKILKAKLKRGLKSLVKDRLPPLTAVFGHVPVFLEGKTPSTGRGG
jgi:hypothetical protein